jgi:hypothetical protein
MLPKNPVSKKTAHERESHAHLAQLGEVDLQHLGVVLEPEAGHRVQDVLAADRLALLERALLARLGRDEADELGHALLHALFRVLGDLRRRRDGVLHDPRDVGDLRGEVFTEDGDR